MYFYQACVSRCSSYRLSPYYVSLLPHCLALKFRTAMAAKLISCSLKEGKGKQYLADDEGHIYSQNGVRRVAHCWKNFQRIPNCHSYYPQVDGCLVSRLVCSAFHGEAAPGQECHHLDGNIRNNRPENLIWLSRDEHKKYDRIQRCLKMAGRDLSKITRQEFIDMANGLRLVDPAAIMEEEMSLA